MSRFYHRKGPAPEGARFSNLAERINAPLPEYDFPDTRAGGTSSRLAAFRAANGTSATTDPGFRSPTTTAAKAAGKVTASPAKAPAATEWDFNGWLRDQAARADAVMCSPEAKGMEKEARVLLDKTNCSASQIKAFLAEEKTAKTRSAQRPKRDAKAQAAIDAIWERANAKLAAQRGTPTQTEAKAHTALPDGKKQDERSAGDVWDRVNAKRNERLVAANPALRSLIENQQPKPAPAGDEVQDVWARAYSKIGRRT